MKSFIKKILMVKYSDSGATAIEYALLAALISVAIIASTTTLSGKIQDAFKKISNDIGSATKVV